MGKNTLVISCDIRETRVALIEDGIIAELHIERRSAQPKGGLVGDVYLGKVTRVLPGLQAAFIDIGLERAAFLHVEDLIRPDDFEAYLAGGRKVARGESTEEMMADAPEGDAEAEAEAEAVAEAQAEAEEQVRAASEEPAELSAPYVTPGDAEAADLGLTEVPPPLAGVDEIAGDEAEDTERPGELEAAADSEAVLAPDSEAALADDADESSDDVAMDALDSAELPVADDLSTSDLGDDEDEGGDVLDTDEGAEAAEVEAAEGAEVPVEAASAEAGGDLDDLFSGDLDLPGFTVTEPGEPTPKAPAPRLEGDRGRGRGRRRRGRGGRPAGEEAARAPRAATESGRGRGGDPRAARPAREGAEARGRGGRDAAEPNAGRAARGGAEARGRGGRDRGRGGRDRNGDRGQSVPGRISKSTPIREVVREGQEIIVQLTKEPIGTKGARCSSHISLAGRYVVYLPTVDHIGVSKRIGSEKERVRLRDAIEGMKPPTGGLIVRTVAEGLTKKQLKQDVGYLVRLWGEIAKNREGARAPHQLSSELDLVLKTARDLFTDEVAQIVIDDKVQHKRLSDFVEMFMPERLKDIALYSGDEPIFDAYGIEDEIGRALSRKVPLPSGGYLILDQAEALTAIDVNTGRFVGKGSKDMEETILKTNLEAVQEIAYQLRFRNIGGLIILDLIDMERAANREKVRKKLEELLQKDKAKTTLNRISDLGLIEMTRKRTRESLGRLLHEPCFYCDGTGQLQSKETIAYEILREIRRKRADLPGYTVLVNCHPAVADLLTGSEKAAVTEAENKHMRKITIVARKEYHLEQFDLTGK